MANPMLLELRDCDRGTLEAWLVQFDQGWQDDALAVWAAGRLPPPGSLLRRAALAEMVKIDLERQWLQGRQLTLGSYLERYPELGTLETVSADLVFAEYQVRQQFGAAADLSEYARRFPAQAAELARLVHAAADHSLPPLSIPPPLPATELDTSRAGRATETVSPHTGSGTEIPETFGRYRILKKLGQGGMGAVYLAHDSQLDRQVALKVPSFAGADRQEMIERFLREARAMATIRHPNLCPVYDVGEIGGVHYMTMAYIEGRLLADQIQSGKPAGERQAATVIRKLAAALQEAHTRGVVHRDLKPANIFIDSSGEPVIVDFGLARRTETRDAALTHSGALVGTPAYMAPEQARGQSAATGPQSDIYSLGVILYELLTGRRPFVGQGALEVLSQVLTTPPEPPRALRPDLDSRLEAICLKAMAKQPADRYASMAEFAAALRDFQAATIQAAASVQPAGKPAAHTPATPVAADQRAWTRPAPRHAQPAARRGAPTSVRRGSRTPPVEAAEADQSIVLAIPSDNEPEALPVEPAESNRWQQIPPAWRWTVLGAVAALALLCLGVVLFFPTREGTVKIELSDPHANVDLRVDGDVISVTGLGQPLRLRTGDHQLVVTGRDFETLTRSFTVKRGTEEPLRITLIPKSAVYTVRVDPPDARLSVSGAGATVAGEGGTRTVTVASPDGQKKVSLLARLNGYPDQEREMRPTPGETGEFAIQMQRLGLDGSGSARSEPLATRVETQGNAQESHATKEEPAPPSGPLPTITNSIGMQLALIPAGEFLMGSKILDRDASEDEIPQHRVRITRPFYLGIQEVTQGQFRRFVEEAEYTDGASEWRGQFHEQNEDHPVAFVNWQDATEFCKWLSTKEEQTYRLPTEAEWEYACRAGKQTRFSFGDEDKDLGEYAWFRDNSDDATHPIGQKKPNAWHLFDMHGNVYEWCADWHNEKYYATSPQDDPRGPAAGSFPVFRGGSFIDGASGCRATCRRGSYPPGYRLVHMGFRLARQFPSASK